MRETTGKWGKIEEMFLSCPPGSERLATVLVMELYLKKYWTNSRLYKEKKKPKKQRCLVHSYAT